MTFFATAISNVIRDQRDQGRHDDVLKVLAFAEQRCGQPMVAELAESNVINIESLRQPTAAISTAYTSISAKRCPSQLRQARPGRARLLHNCVVSVVPLVNIRPIILANAYDFSQRCLISLLI